MMRNEDHTTMRSGHGAGRVSNIACLFAACLAGCARIDAPKGYVTLRHPYGYDFKAVSARGNVFAMTARRNPGGKDADLGFWTQALEHQKVDLEGYRLEGRQEIKTEAGQAGTLFDLRSGTGAAEYTWLIALLVTPSRIYTVEAAGPTAQIKDDLPHIRAAIATLRRW